MVLTRSAVSSNTSQDTDICASSLPHHYYRVVALCSSPALRLRKNNGKQANAGRNFLIFWVIFVEAEALTSHK